MAHYSLWISGANGKQPAEALADVGLSALLDDRDLAPSILSPPSGTPCGGPGLLIQWLDVNSDEPPALGMRPDVQTWKRVADSPLWYGSEPARPVRAIDLQRKSEFPNQPRYSGRVVWLGEKDSQSAWWVPNQLDLPKTFVMDESGTLTRVVAKAHETTWERMHAAYRAARFEWLSILERQWATLSAEQREAIPAPEKPTAADAWDDGQAWNHVAWGLSLNYRVFRFVINELRLLTESNTWPTLQAMTDLEALSVLQAQSKNLDAQREAVISAGPSSNGGARE